MNSEKEFDSRLMGVPAELRRIFDINTAGLIPPRKIKFGLGAADYLGTEAEQFVKSDKALVVSDENLKKSGAVERVSKSLEKAGYSVEEFAEVEPDPHIEAVETIFDRYKSSSPFPVIGLGGGSVMDVAKLASLALGQKVDPIKIITKEVLPASSEYPLILMPTTAGTGSDVSSFINVAVGETKLFIQSPYCFADVAIIDPLLAASMPPSITASTGIDALSHAVEAMMHQNANPLTDAWSLTSIEMIAKNLRKAVADGDDLVARYYMSMGATVAMMTMSLAGGLWAHSVSYVIPMYEKMPHGIGCGIGLPYLMDFNLPVACSKFVKIAQVMGVNTMMMSELDAAMASIREVGRLIRDVGLPVTLKEWKGLEEDKLEEMATIMVEKFPRPMNVRSMSQNDAVIYWKNMWNGSLSHGGSILE